MVGTPITLMNRTEPVPGMPDTEPMGILEDILVQGNRIVGADGLGIIARGLSPSRISDNTIMGIRRRAPFPGLTWDGYEHRWEEANGSAIWVSPGSDGNEIAGNRFEDIAAAAVYVEGDSNRVELQNAGDTVRDLGSGNRVSGPAGAREPTADPSPTRILEAGRLGFHPLLHPAGDTAGRQQQ